MAPWALRSGARLVLRVAPDWTHRQALTGRMLRAGEEPPRVPGGEPARRLCGPQRARWSRRSGDPSGGLFPATSAALALAHLAPHASRALSRTVAATRMPTTRGSLTASTRDPSGAIQRDARAPLTPAVLTYVPLCRVFVIAPKPAESRHSRPPRWIPARAGGCGTSPVRRVARPPRPALVVAPVASICPPRSRSPAKNRMAAAVRPGGRRGEKPWQ